MCRRRKIGKLLLRPLVGMATETNENSHFATQFTSSLIFQWLFDSFYFPIWTNKHTKNFVFSGWKSVEKCQPFLFTCCEICATPTERKSAQEKRTTQTLQFEKNALMRVQRQFDVVAATQFQALIPATIQWIRWWNTSAVWPRQMLRTEAKWTRRTRVFRYGTIDMRAHQKSSSHPSNRNEKNQKLVDISENSKSATKSEKSSFDTENKTI